MITFDYVISIAYEFLHFYSPQEPDNEQELIFLAECYQMRERVVLDPK